MAAISDLPSAWRGDLLPASFRNATFHVETGSREGGRRVVMHEFPKKELPYAEDMGHRAVEFSVRGYVIQFPRDTQAPLYQRDYRNPRNALLQELETGGSGRLQLPTLAPMTVRVTRYRLTEEQRMGGMCVFDMTFVELGAPPPFTPISSQAQLVAESKALAAQVQDWLKQAGIK